jgi:hypothetical protein
LKNNAFFHLLKIMLKPAPSGSVKFLVRAPANWLKFGFILALALGVSPLSKRLSILSPALPDQHDQATAPLVPQAAQILSFGHLPALVDSLLLRVLADPAIGPVSPGTHPASFTALELATQLDPDWFELYWISGNLLSVIRWDGRGAGLILDRAHDKIRSNQFPTSEFRESQWPQAWQLELLRGYNALFELQDFEAARESFATAATLPGAYSFLKPLSERLATRAGKIEVAERTLRSLLQRKNPKVVQTELEARWREIQLVQWLLRLEERFLESQAPSFEGFLKKIAISSDPLGGLLYWDAQQKRIRTSSPAGKLLRLYLD